MTASTLDRFQLEAIVLGETGAAASSRGCGEHAVPPYLSEAFVGRSVVDSPELMERYLRVHFAGAERETFAVIFLDVRHRVISVKELVLQRSGRRCLRRSTKVPRGADPKVRSCLLACEPAGT